MSFPRSLVLLVSVVLCVAFVLFAGHGVARHQLAPVLWGLGLLASGVALVFAQTRRGRKT